MDTHCATLCIIRAYDTYDRFKLNIWLDDKKIGDMGAGEKKNYVIPMGEHQIYVSRDDGGKTRPLIIDAKHEETVVLTCGIGFWGLFLKPMMSQHKQIIQLYENVNMYAEPSVQSALKAQFRVGLMVYVTDTIKQDNKSWFKIRDFSGKEGFISGQAKFATIGKLHLAAMAIILLWMCYVVYTTMAVPVASSIISSWSKQADAEATRLSVRATQLPIQTSLAPVCQGGGVPAAAVYDASKTGPHRIAILTLTGKPHEWHEKLPQEWLPSRVEDAELVACVGDEEEFEIGSACEYVDDTFGFLPASSAQRLQFKRQVRVIAAQTGQVIIDQMIEGSMPLPCPKELPSQVTRIEGSHLNQTWVEDWLKPLVYK